MTTGSSSHRLIQRGFTLTEVLIALFIFSLIAAGSIYALRLGIEAADQFELGDARVRQLQHARILIKEDLAQLAQRRTRNEFGLATPGSFFGGRLIGQRPQRGEGDILFALVRYGWRNPDYAAPRPSLQYVEYVQIEDRLVRRTRPFFG